MNYLRTPGIADLMAKYVNDFALHWKIYIKENFFAFEFWVVLSYPNFPIYFNIYSPKPTTPKLM